MIEVCAVAHQAMEGIYTKTIDEQNASKIKTISVERFLEASRTVNIDTGSTAIKKDRAVPDLVPLLTTRMGLSERQRLAVTRAGKRGGVLYQLWLLLYGHLSTDTAASEPAEQSPSWDRDRDNDLKFAFHMSAAIHAQHPTGANTYWGVLFGPALFGFIATRGASHLLTMQSRGGGFAPSVDTLQRHLDDLVQAHRNGAPADAIAAARARGGALTLVTDNYCWLCPCRVMTSTRGTFMQHDNTVCACKPDFDGVQVVSRPSPKSRVCLRTHRVHRAWCAP